MKKIRLNKFIADCGAASRRDADELINEGRVEINGKIVMELGVSVDPDNDVVELDGEKISIPRKVYYLLNKPKKTISSTKDEKGRKTVIELIKSPLRLYPVGRLDYNTTGVMILTNDGDFKNFLTHPKNRALRVYRVELDRPLEANYAERMRKGIMLEGVRGKFIDVKYLKKNKKIVEVSAEEGRNHFVKEMFRNLGYAVKELHRISFAGLTADDLPQGKYRKLSPLEIQRLYEKFQ